MEQIKGILNINSKLVPYVFQLQYQGNITDADDWEWSQSWFCYHEVHTLKITTLHHRKTYIKLTENWIKIIHQIKEIKNFLINQKQNAIFWRNVKKRKQRIS